MASTVFNKPVDDEITALNSILDPSQFINLGNCSVGSGSVSYGNHKRLYIVVMDASSNVFIKDLLLIPYFDANRYVNIGGNSNGDIIININGTTGNKYMTLYRCGTGSTLGGTLNVYAMD